MIINGYGSCYYQEKRKNFLEYTGELEHSIAVAVRAFRPTIAVQVLNNN